MPRRRSRARRCAPGPAGAARPACRGRAHARRGGAPARSGRLRPGPATCSDPDDVELRELEERRREIADERRAADLVHVELGVAASGEPLLGARLGLPVQERGADDQRRRVERAYELLRLELRGAVGGDRPRLVLLHVRRALLAVEDEVGREVESRAPRGAREGDGCCACGSHVSISGLGRWAIRRVDDDVGVLSEEDTRRSPLSRTSSRTGRPCGGGASCASRARRGRLDRLAADLGAEVPGAAGDEELHPSTIVTGPSFTSSTAMRAPKTPCSTGTPSARSSAQKARRAARPARAAPPR